jgi:hypothetical protein
MVATIAGLPRENAGMEAIPLLFRLTDALALSFLLRLKVFSWEKEAVAIKRNSRQNDNLIFFISGKLIWFPQMPEIDKYTNNLNDYMSIFCFLLS